jgi:hypothetical protein
MSPTLIVSEDEFLDQTLFVLTKLLEFLLNVFIFAHGGLLW